VERKKRVALGRGVSAPPGVALQELQEYFHSQESR
jgi:hypothetical protein